MVELQYNISSARRVCLTLFRLFLPKKCKGSLASLTLIEYSRGESKPILLGATIFVHEGGSVTESSTVQPKMVGDGGG